MGADVSRRQLHNACGRRGSSGAPAAGIDETHDIGRAHESPLTVFEQPRAHCELPQLRADISPANPPLPAPGTQGSDLDIRAEFDGWAYYHLLDRASLQEEGYYAPGELFDEDYASGFGDLAMHNVEGDPDVAEADRAYIAWYSLGMRVIENNTGDIVAPPGGDWDAATPPVDDYYAENVTEVGRFIAEDGSNFWGVHVHKTASGDELILASDRNSGLWIFQYNPNFCEAAEGFSCP
jgi:hypothetical protein